MGDLDLPFQVDLNHGREKLTWCCCCYCSSKLSIPFRVWDILNYRQRKNRMIGIGYCTKQSNKKRRFKLYKNTLMLGQENEENESWEILKIFGSDKNSMITYEDLEKCQYIDALIKETIRHTNPIPYNIRILDGDESIDKSHWESGTWFWIDHHRIMNNPNYWKEPNKFNPDRFLSEEHGGTGEFSNMYKNRYIPFGGGLRMCPARNIVLIELKLLVVLIFRKYNIEPVNKNESIKYVYRGTNQVHDFMVKVSQKQ
ncbi:cytochrome p450 [Gigaspora margarita]|uniref:Cytochrome p450 n=1 Tax=Gigaspora margarita TaxID=4874 RepID=A0A8H4ALG8_GIGMA|nr:cytochrome p450 [Gigaspora margarita]